MTTPTKLPIPSNNLLDSRFNFEKLDQIVNSDANFYVDRFGKQRLTAKGLEDLINRIEGEFENSVSSPDGYRLIGKATSFEQLRTIRPLVDGQRIFLNGWRVGSSAGGGEFVAKFGVKEDDGGCVAAGDGFYWERIIHYGFYSPEMFGAVGDGLTDDFTPIANMLKAGPANCTFLFSSGKTYYNAFANNGVWISLLDRNMWQRSLPATFDFNGSTITRRLAEWNNNNAKNNTNSGAYYTDEGTALLYLSGSGYTIKNANFNGNVGLGAVVDASGNPTSSTGYAIGTCMDYGLYLDNVTDIEIIDSVFTNACFPILCNTCTNVRARNLTIAYAAQASSRLTGADLALGGGIKLISCTDVNLSGIYGYRNVNCTVEIEPYNTNVYVQGKSENDYSNSLVILYSSHIIFDWVAKNVTAGNGITIRGGASTKKLFNIQGRAIVDTCSWIGCQIFISSAATSGISGLKLDLITLNTKKNGLSISNNGSSYGIEVDIDHNHYGDTVQSQCANLIDGLVFGNIRGSVHNSPIGIQITGTNTQTKCMRADLDLRDGITLPISVGANAYISLNGTDTSTVTAYSSPLQYLDIKNSTLANAVNESDGWIRTYGRYTSLESKGVRLTKASTTNDASSSGLFLTGTAPNYTVSLYRSS